jgi:colanic acid/amylovoran biosynthesis glycosyltransferase
MRILHFVESFSQPTETFIKRYVQKSCQFAQVGVVAFNFQNIENDKDELSLFEITGKLYSRKTIPGVIRFVTEQLSGMRLWYHQLNNAIQTFKPDIIHCHFGNTGIMMMQFNRKFHTNIPYVTSFYGYDISSLPNIKNYRDNLTKLWISGNGFFAEGPELVKKLTTLGCPETKCLVNPLLIPIEDYPIKKDHREVGSTVKFLFIGRFIEKKGLHLFLKAIGLIKDRIGEFSIDIIGTGPYQEVYEQIIAEYNLQFFIKWHGMVKHANIIQMMKDYDFLVHPSLTAKDGDSEGGAPTIIIEAQAIGLPVITSTHADIPYIMGYHHFLAEEGSVLSLAAIIEDIVNCDDIEYYTKQGANKVSQLHNLATSSVYETNLKQLTEKN